MTYVDENNQLQRPFIIHRSSIGCYERTIAFLLEQYAGKLPFWLSPDQAVVMTITSDIDDYARQVHEKLRERSIRAKIDLRSDTINKKVRDAQKEYIPLMITVGQKEQDNKTVALRTLDGTVKYGIGLDAFLDYVSALQAKRALTIDLSDLGDK
jgi:threonyl-tRNA synthetase